ncbi:MAG: potassium-transporting ATPase subunit KdpC [Candidatus Baltobacteraceae bacterium]
MLKHLSAALRMTTISVILFGLCYPVAIWGIGRVAFPWQSAGSYVRVNGHIVGSAIVGQRWQQPRYFHGRPSAAGKGGYDPTATGGSNLGPDSKALLTREIKTIAHLKRANPAAGAPPIDLVTESGSGIDPDISPADARYQAPRVAAARRLPLRRVLALIERQTQPRTFGILGEPRINVLALNLALDRLR